MTTHSSILAWQSHGQWKRNNNPLQYSHLAIPWTVEKEQQPTPVFSPGNPMDSGEGTTTHPSILAWQSHGQWSQHPAVHEVAKELARLSN